MARFILSAFADEADKMLDGQIEAMKENGVACVELRGVDGKNVKDLTIDEAKDVRARLDAAGIRVSSMGSPFGKISVTDDFEEHLKQFAHALELCKVLGCDRMRMFSFYYPKDEDPEKYQDVVFERIEKMLELAEKAGVTLCHENEKGIYGDIASRCLKLIEHFGGRLKCIFDPANFIQCGEKPIENFALLKDHIYYMHIKDALLANGAVVPSGCGDGNVPEIIRQLSARADGMVLTVEPHLTVFDGLKNLQDEEVKHEYTYASSREAFHAAVSAIQKILKDQGFESKKTGEWTKMDKVRIGIIGVGNMGSGHLKNIVADKVPDMVLTAVCDLKPERLEWAKENAPGVATFDDATKMMKSGLIDAVIVATPHYDHPRLVREALEHGLHAMSEKPAGVYTKNVHELIEFAKTQDKIYAIMFNQRTNCVYRKMKEIVSSGEMGAIRRTNWIITNWYRPQSYFDSGDWRATWSGEGGGVLLNQSPHQLDLWQWICGMPVKVDTHMQFGKWHDIEVEDDVTTYVEYENGATGVFITSTGEAHGTNRLEIQMDRAQIVTDGKELHVLEFDKTEQEFSAENKIPFATVDAHEIVPETDGKNEQHIGVLNAFGGAILDGTPLIADGREGIRGLTLSNAMHLSAFLGHPVEIPFDEDLYYAELMKRVATSRRKTGGKTVFADTSNTYSGNH